MAEALGRLEYQLDEWGRPAWIIVMVLGFIVFWPIGLAVLAYMIWSGRMACGRSGGAARWKERMAGRWERRMNAWGMQAKAYEPTGNRAFDDYREETLKRLESEAQEFTDFLERLRMAKDREEFEAFMRERRSRPAPGEGSVPPTGQPPEGPRAD